MTCNNVWIWQNSLKIVPTRGAAHRANIIAVGTSLKKHKGTMPSVSSVHYQHRELSNTYKGQFLNILVTEQEFRTLHTPMIYFISEHTSQAARHTWIISVRCSILSVIAFGKIFISTQSMLQNGNHTLIKMYSELFCDSDFILKLAHKMKSGQLLACIDLYRCGAWLIVHWQAAVFFCEKL